MSDRQHDTARWRPSSGYLVLAGLLAVVAPLVAWWWAPSSSPPPAAAPQPQSDAVAVRLEQGASVPAAAAAPAPALVAAAPVAAPSAPVVRTARTRDPNGDLTPDLADYLNPGEAPSMAEVIARLHAAGVSSGLGAFSPPGTRPPLIGLAVPETYALPEGYVRHHQATDDGQRIEAILMFAPGFQLYDTAGQPVAMPADRVVPPELAPPGLPLRRIVVPAAREPGR